MKPKLLFEQKQGQIVTFWRGWTVGGIAYKIVDICNSYARLVPVSWQDDQWVETRGKIAEIFDHTRICYPIQTDEN